MHEEKENVAVKMLKGEVVDGPALMEQLLKVKV